MSVQARLYSENLGLDAASSSPDWVMSSDFGVNDGLFFDLQQEQPQPMLHQQQGLQSLGISNGFHGSSSSSSGGDFLSVAFPQPLAALLENQRQEIDWLLLLQSERLRTVLREEARQQLASLLQRYESKMVSLMWGREKDLEIAKKKTTQLEECLRMIEMENRNWQMKAKENEAKVADLNNTIAHVRDTASGCGSSNRGDIDRGEAKDREDGRERRRGVDGCCKVCCARISCVVLLPCRHLCSCKSCEAFLGFCPVCESVKQASIEVFLG